MPNEVKPATEAKTQDPTSRQTASGIAARLMQQPTPVCDCTRCGMDYCDCSEEQQGTVGATGTEYFRR